MAREGLLTTGVVLVVVTGMIVLLVGVGGGNDGFQLAGGAIALTSVMALAAFIARL
jgi:predicted glycosyltransferase